MAKSKVEKEKAAPGIAQLRSDLKAALASLKESKRMLKAAKSAAKEAKRTWKRARKRLEKEQSRGRKRANSTRGAGGAKIARTKARRNRRASAEGLAQVPADPVAP